MNRQQRRTIWGLAALVGGACFCLVALIFTRPTRDGPAPTALPQPSPTQVPELVPSHESGDAPTPIPSATLISEAGSLASPTVAPIQTRPVLLTLEWPPELGTGDTSTIILILKEDPTALGQVTVTAQVGGVVSTPVTGEVPVPGAGLAEVIAEATLVSGGFAITPLGLASERSGGDECGDHRVAQQSRVAEQGQIVLDFRWAIRPCGPGTHTLNVALLFLGRRTATSPLRPLPVAEWKTSKQVRVQTWVLPSGYTTPLGLVSALLGGIALSPYARRRWHRRHAYPEAGSRGQPALPPNFDPGRVPRTHLFTTIRSAMDSDELRALCFHLQATNPDLHFDDLGESFRAQVIALIEYFENRDRYADFVRALLAVRPDLLPELLEITPPVEAAR